MYVSVNTVTLKRKTSEIHSSLVTSFSLISNVKNKVDEITSIWQGMDNDLFTSKMMDFTDELKKLNASMHTYKVFVEGYVEAVTKLDEGYGSKKVDLK